MVSRGAAPSKRSAWLSGGCSAVLSAGAAIRPLFGPCSPPVASPAQVRWCRCVEVSVVEVRLRERKRWREVFANHGLPLNPVVCWTSDGRCLGEQLIEAADGDTQDAQDAIGPFQLY